MTRSRLAATTALLLALAAAGPALADPPDTSREQARRLYETGTQHFNLAEYAAAIAAYKDAYRLFPEPYFLYNVAQAYRLDGDDRQAVRFYKNFLNARPDAPERAEVERRIAELEAAIAKAEAARNAAPTGPRPPGEPPVKRVPSPAEAIGARDHIDAPPTAPLAGRRGALEPRDHGARPRIYTRWWFWVGVGVVAAGASTAALMAGGAEPPASDLGNFPVF